MTRGVGVNHGPQHSASRGRITSPSNPQVKAIRALRDRKERERTGHCYVEGIRAVAAALESGVHVHQIVVATDLLASDFARDVVRSAERRGAAIMEVSPSVFQSISSKDGPQGLALVACQKWVHLSDVRLAPTGVWLALSASQDAGNVGSILRTCDAVRVAGVVLVGPSVDPYDPSSLRASTGAAFTIPLARASWSDFAAWIAREQVPLVGATGDAPTSYRAAEYPPRLVLLMGSERDGLSNAQQASCSLLVHIPMRGTVDSLNLAVATSLILYEIFGHR